MTSKESIEMFEQQVALLSEWSRAAASAEELATLTHAMCEVADRLNWLFNMPGAPGKAPAQSAQPVPPRCGARPKDWRFLVWAALGVVFALIITRYISG